MAAARTPTPAGSSTEGPFEMHETIADELSIQADRVEATLELLDADNTVPFIARYRKDATGELDEVQIRDIRRAADRLRALEKRRETVRSTIREQGELTDELSRKIEEATTRPELDDLYAPYRPKRKTRGKRALDAGLEPVADTIQGGESFDSMLEQFVCDDFETPEEVLTGARDIIAERIADEPDVRKRVREYARENGRLTCDRRRGAEEDATFESYYEFATPVSKAKPHQVLAIRRGEEEKALSAGIEVNDDIVLDWIEDHIGLPDGPGRGEVETAIEDGWDRLLHPRTERHIRGELEEEADAHAIGVFAVNLENLLLQPPLPNRSVLGVDPGYRSGCKVVAVDRDGAVEATGKIFVHDDRRSDAKETLAELVERHEIDVVAVGNGTASRETEEVVAEVVAEADDDPAYAVIDEAGASVYSASEIARRELPELDVSMRGAVSIARRLQDPLAELVKIDPKSIGVGMYQHDVDQNRLADKLSAVVEDVVNSVGIDLNTASRELLSHVAGIGPVTAERIVEFRDQRGPYRKRTDLLEVKGIGEKTFEQCAGFLRIRSGDEPLDGTAIHPDHYPLAEDLLEVCDAEFGSSALSDALDEIVDSGEGERLRQRHDVGRHTFRDIVDALTRPGRDPRDELEPPELRSDVLEMDDLQPGMQLTGTVRNVVDFGAFVDVGVKEDGLVHISEMADQYVESPHEIVGVGDQIDVVVQSIDMDRGRIGLSMREADRK